MRPDATSTSRKPFVEPVLATIARVSVHALAAMALAFPLTRASGVLSAGFGAVVGATVARGLAKSALRSPVVVAGGLAAFAMAFGLRHLVVGTGLFSSLGPGTMLKLGDAVFLAGAAFAVSAVLRTLSIRRRAFAIGEVALIGIAFAQLVVGHRQGAINRPFEIADPLLAQGADPTVAFLALGAFASFVLMVVLLRERSVWRALFHIGIVSLLVLLVVGTTRMLGLPAPSSGAGGLGLRGDASDTKPKEGEGGGSRPRDGRRNNDELEFRDEYNTSGARAPVGVVIFHDDYSAPNGVYYFRQGAFSQYNGRRLIASTRSDVDRDIAPGFPSQPIEVADVPEVGASRATLETTVALLAEHTRPFALEAPLRFEPAPNPDPARFKRSYRTSSAVLTADAAAMFGSAAGDPRWTREQWEHYTTAPEDPRYAELARKVLEEELPPELREEPLARTLAITSWLGANGTYSLKSRHASAEDPTAHFLFGDKTGYCVHFAHAATYLFRALGLPARVATGYAVEEAARQGGSALLVSGENSHAWPEVYFEGLGWVVADVVPQTVLDPPPQPPDPDLQRLLGELLRGQQALPPDAAASLPRIAAEARRFGVTFATFVLFLFAATLLGLSAGKAWRRVAPAIAGPTSLPRVLYRAELDRLSDLSVRRRRGESREAFAARVRALAPSFDTLTHVHVGAAFGSRRPIDREALRALRTALRSELRQRYPLWRRLLGALLPWTWLSSR